VKCSICYAGITSAREGFLCDHCKGLNFLRRRGVRVSKKLRKAYEEGDRALRKEMDAKKALQVIG